MLGHQGVWRLRITDFWGFAGAGVGPALLVLGGEREAKSHILRFICVPKVESGTFSSGSCISLEWETPKNRTQSS